MAGQSDDAAYGRAIKDDFSDELNGAVDACEHEWAILRDQTPNPEHAEIVVRELAHGA
jgi:hypothetical protein